MIAFAVVLAIAFAGAAGWGWLRRTAGPPSSSASPVPSPADAPASAREVLRAYAATTAAQTDVVPAGRYAYVRTQSWSQDLTSTPPGTTSIEERMWWAADHSGRRIVQSPGSPPSDLSYRAGELSVVIDQPSARPEILAGQMQAYDSSPGTRTTLRTVAEIYRWHPLGPAQRAALLRVLADTDGLADRGIAADRADRHGLAISADTTAGGVTTRDILIFDTVTARLLSYEQILLTEPREADVTTPALLSYVLYLDATRVDAMR